MTRLLPALLLVLTNGLCAAEPLKEPGAMLRLGNYDGVGSYGIPDALKNLKPANWPVKGWYQIIPRDAQIEITAVSAPKTQIPEFLKKIAEKIAAPTDELDTPQHSNIEQAPEPDPLYLRVPGVRLKEGNVPIYRFKNGTARLQPKLDYQYDLSFNGMQFSLTVQNGFKGKNGASYGEGAQYTIEYEGNKFEYNLGMFGWDSSISAIGDLDGDGKPDFIIYVGGSNSSGEFILLSSKAKPGRNPPTASLYSFGC